MSSFYVLILCPHFMSSFYKGEIHGKTLFRKSRPPQSSEKSQMFIGKLKMVEFRSRRVHFRWFDNRSRDLNEIHRSKVVIRIDHNSRSWCRNHSKNTKLESWESGESNFEDASLWGFVYLKIWRFRKSLENGGLLFRKKPFRPPSEGGRNGLFRKSVFSLNFTFEIH